MKVISFELPDSIDNREIQTMMEKFWVQVACDDSMADHKKYQFIKGLYEYALHTIE